MATLGPIIIILQLNTCTNLCEDMSYDVQSGVLINLICSLCYFLAAIWRNKLTSK